MNKGYKTQGGNKLYPSYQNPDYNTVKSRLGPQMGKSSENKSKNRMDRVNLIKGSNTYQNSVNG